MAPAIIILNGADDVAVCCRAVAAGEELVCGDTRLLARQHVPLGHKIALHALASGARIRKYGVPIGSATCAVAPGEWVHLHNMRSDYLPAHGRGGVTAG